MIIYVDIDDTICHYDNYDNLEVDMNTKYPKAEPIEKNIDKINKLHNEGHTIIYWTARGSVTGIDWSETTTNQLKKWGCKFHNVSVGEKPAYDLLICDKTKRIEEI